MIKSNAINLLCYFDVFNHPLRYSEIALLLNKEESEVINELKPLLDKGAVFVHENFVSIQKELKGLVEIRKEKEERAKQYLEKMPFYMKRIRNFPFVEAVGISGSLSKNVMHEDGDIDYFVITKKGRLWICRTLLIGFKKIVLLNSRKYFCLNYFVDEENLKIPDENAFTAIEIAYLLPVLNFDRIEEFKTKNEWSQAFVTNFEHPLKQEDFKGKRGWGALVAWLLKGKLGDRLDLYLMKFTYRKWQKKFPDFDMDKFELTMRTNRGVSKHHPRNFQERVLKEYRERLEKLSILTDENTVYA